MAGIQFYRPARSYPPVLSEQKVVIKAPPTLPAGPKGIAAVLQIALPIVASLGGAVMIFAFGSNPLFLFAGIFMVVGGIGGSVGMAFVQRHTQKKQFIRQEQVYGKYLAQHETRLKALAQQQRMVSKRLYPTYADLVRLVKQQKYIWERRPDDKDFLTVRFGTVAAPLSCEVTLEQERDMMTEYIPELRVRAQAVVDKWNALPDMPSLINMREIGVLAISGRPEATRALARALICQILAFQSPADVRCMAYFPEDAASAWSWLKWAPHVRRMRQIKVDKRTAPEHIYMLAHTAEDVGNLFFNQIKPELDRRRRLNEDKQRDKKVSITRPHLFLLLDSFSPFSEVGQLAELDPIMNDATQFGVTVICLVEQPGEEPAQVQARLSINTIGLVDYEELKVGGKHTEGVAVDAVDPKTCEHISRAMAPLSLAEAGAQQDLSQDVKLLELLDLPAADIFEISETWKTRRGRYEMLKVPLGVRADGQPLFIDVKEAAEKGMGPHGLCIGATGSGKSELLRTLIISLALTHDPETVSFVLIDFKGGASFADFGALPHVAGIITNLADDLSLVDRVYFSLLGEQLRRQRMLHDAGNLDNIKQYREKWRLNPNLGMEPMPHMLLIADEFAELMAHRPEFLDLFITMGRVGRSLGIHLLFATQRLEEGRIKGLEGHLRYRICLRTFSTDESKTVLGKPDAYYLPSAPGVGYFKVDTDTYHMFKTALISVPYIPGQGQASVLSRIRKFTTEGKLVCVGTLPGASPAADSNADPGDDPAATAKVIEEKEGSDLHTEMDVVIERIARLAQAQECQPVHMVWLPPLPKQLPLATVLQQAEQQTLDGRSWSKHPPLGTLHVPMGLLDMPQEQTQVPYMLDFSGAGGHLAIVGAPQTGKSTFLRMLVTSLMLTHSPHDVQIYAIDLGGGLLRIFEHAPHVGSVCSKADRDKIRRTVRQMRKVIEDREYFFREQSIDNMTTFRARRAKGELSDFPFGDVFLLIDNFGLFMQEFEALEDDMVQIIGSGLTYGVHIVLATNRWFEVRTKVRDNIGTRLEFRLNDPGDSEFGKQAANGLPVGIPGRGLNKQKLHFQVALPLLEASTDEELPPIQEALEAFVQRVRQHWDGPSAPPVLLLPAMVHREEILARNGQGKAGQGWAGQGQAAAPTDVPGLLLGLEEFRLEPIFLDLLSTSTHFLILGDTECGKTSLLRGLLRGFEQRYKHEDAVFAIIDYRKALVDFVESKHLLKYAYNADTLKECLDIFRTELLKRQKTDGNGSLANLLAPKKFSGQRYFLFVDDYDMLTSGSSTPLSSIVEFLPAGADVGFHVVIARRVSGMARSAFEPVTQRIREMGASGLIMSGEKDEGRVMHNQFATAQPPGRGYLVQRGHPSTLVQVAFTEPAYAIT